MMSSDGDLALTVSSLRSKGPSFALTSNLRVNGQAPFHCSAAAGE